MYIYMFICKVTSARSIKFDSLYTCDFEVTKFKADKTKVLCIKYSLF